MSARGELRRSQIAETRELDARVALRAETGEDSREVDGGLFAQCVQLHGDGRESSRTVHGVIPIAPLCSGSRPTVGEAGRMPALTRNRRFARGHCSSERAGTPAGADSKQTVEACGAESGRTCPIPPLAHIAQGALCRKGPHGSRRAGLLRKELPMGSDFRARRGLRALVVTTVMSHGTDRRVARAPRARRRPPTPDEHNKARNGSPTRSSTTAASSRTSASPIRSTPRTR